MENYKKEIPILKNKVKKKLKIVRKKNIDTMTKRDKELQKTI